MKIFEQAAEPLRGSQNSTTSQPDSRVSVLITHQLDARVADEAGKQTDGIAAAADARHHYVWQAARPLEDLEGREGKREGDKVGW